MIESFCKDISKRTSNGPFSNSLALSRPTSMIEIRTRVEKHVEAEEDKEDRLQAEKELLTVGKKTASRVQAHQHYGLRGAGHMEARAEKYIPLKATRTQILKEVYHLHLLDMPPPTEQQLGRFVKRMENEKRTTGELPERDKSRTPRRDRDREQNRSEHRQKSQSRSRGQTPPPPPSRNNSNNSWRAVHGRNVGLSPKMVLSVGVGHSGKTNQEGSSANVLFLSAFKKLGFLESNLDCLGTLIDFVGEQVEIRAVINLETISGTGSARKAVKMRFTMVNSPTSFNVILG
ncbi:hypothetical protein CR513_25220, partial [Mucuna pruriens]